MSLDSFFNCMCEHECYPKPLLGRRLVVAVGMPAVLVFSLSSYLYRKPENLTASPNFEVTVPSHLDNSVVYLVKTLLY